MKRRGKKKADVPNGQAPPRESDEDRLIRTGMSMWFARDLTEDTPTREEVEAVLMNEGANAHPAALPPDIRRRFADLGRQDPRPFIERLKRSCRKLLEKVRSKEMQEEGRMVERIQATLADLELVLAVRRYGGRPKGSRKKVTPDAINELRKWKAGDRSWVSSSSVADVAKKLNVSKQTVHSRLATIPLSRKFDSKKLARDSYQGGPIQQRLRVSKRKIAAAVPRASRVDFFHQSVSEKIAAVQKSLPPGFVLMQIEWEEQTEDWSSHVRNEQDPRGPGRRLAGKRQGPRRPELSLPEKPEDAVAQEG